MTLLMGPPTPPSPVAFDPSIQRVLQQSDQSKQRDIASAFEEKLDISESSASSTPTTSSCVSLSPLHGRQGNRGSPLAKDAETSSPRVRVARISPRGMPCNCRTFEDCMKILSQRNDALSLYTRLVAGAHARLPTIVNSRFLEGVEALPCSVRKIARFDALTPIVGGKSWDCEYQVEGDKEVYFACFQLSPPRPPSAVIPVMPVVSLAHDRERYDIDVYFPHLGLQGTIDALFSSVGQ